MLLRGPAPEGGAHPDVVADHARPAAAAPGPGLAVGAQSLDGDPFLARPSNAGYLEQLVGSVPEVAQKRGAVLVGPRLQLQLDRDPAGDDRACEAQSSMVC